MDLSYFVRCLGDYRQAHSSRVGQAVIDDAWSKLLAVAIELRGSAPSEASPEVAAAYAVGNARVAKNAARDFDSIDSTMDAWLAALEQFHQIVTYPG